MVIITKDLILIYRSINYYLFSRIETCNNKKSKIDPGIQLTGSD